MLRSARLVTAQETEDGRRWAESRIKALTGGDPITARFMRQDFFTYRPQFKLRSEAAQAGCPARFIARDGRDVQGRAPAVAHMEMTTSSRPPFRPICGSRKGPAGRASRVTQHSAGMA
jgi:hypothetical protein